MRDGKIIDPDFPGVEKWYLRGVLHRIDGPAVVKDGVIEWWYQWGKLHRMDGPAVCDLRSGYAAWYLKGVDLSFENFLIHALISQEDKTALVLKYA